MLRVVKGDQRMFGARIREARVRKRLSQSKLAKLVGSSQPTLSRWELAADSDDDPDAQAYDRFLRILWRIAEVTGEEFSYLCVGEGSGSTHPNRDAAVSFAKACQLLPAAIERVLARDLEDMAAREWLKLIEDEHQRIVEGGP